MVPAHPQATHSQSTPQDIDERSSYGGDGGGSGGDGGGGVDVVEIVGSCCLHVSTVLIGIAVRYSFWLQIPRLR